MRVGVVCPYSFDVPGGVQFHVRDLAEHLTRAGHDVSVLAPADDDTPCPATWSRAGRAVPGARTTGAVAQRHLRAAVGGAGAPLAGRRRFDVLHIHEPTTPEPVDPRVLGGVRADRRHLPHLEPRSRAMQAAYPILIPAIEKITARIAVSEEARRTLVEHLGGDAVVVPNGIYVDRFAGAPARPEWKGRAGTLGFVGRIDEPRKGLAVLLRAFERVVAQRPGTRLLVAGRGDADEAAQRLPDAVRDAVTFLGEVTDAEKAQLLRTVDAYVAPNLGGESFGIILVEAMAAGAPVIASNLEAFTSVLEDGRAGVLVPVEDAEALAGAALELLADAPRRHRLAAQGARVAQRYDWTSVADEVLAVYETVTAGAARVAADAADGDGRGRLARWLR
jgi:phosphatidylinositol alpha-mannosyltransferase